MINNYDDIEYTRTWLWDLGMYNNLQNIINAKYVNVKKFHPYLPVSFFFLKYPLYHPPPISGFWRLHTNPCNFVLALNGLEPRQNYKDLYGLWSHWSMKGPTSHPQIISGASNCLSYE